jgi:site-specific DNA-methyltransferase (adenine-specific)
LTELPTDAEPVRVVEGDCLDVLPRLPAGCVGAVVTDPPYGIGLKNNGNFSRDWAIRGDADQSATMAAAAWADERKLPLCMFGSAYRPIPGEWRNVLAWDKGPAVGAGGDPRTCWKRTFDLIFVRNNRPLKEGRDSAVLKFWQSPNFRSDFAHHPAAKPVPLMRYLIRQLTDPGDLILDPFAGSGTTGVAAALEGRRCLLVEQDPAYAEIARKRVAAALSAGLFAGATP